MRVHLISGWRRAWRLSSVQAAALLSVLSILTVLHEQVLPLFAFAIPPLWYPWIAGVWGAAIIVLRLIAQPGALDAPDAVAQPSAMRDGQRGFVHGSLLLAAAGVLAALALGYASGWQQAGKRCTRAAQVAQAQAAAHTAQAVQEAQAVADGAQSTQAAIRTVFKERVIRQYVEVPREVLIKEDAGCVIPARFVGLWNSANRAELSAAAGEFDAATNGVALSDVAAQHEREAELCHANTEQLKALQAAERARQRAFAGARP